MLKTKVIAIIGAVVMVIGLIIGFCVYVNVISAFEILLFQVILVSSTVYIPSFLE